MIASRLGIASYRRLRRRQERVEFRAEIASKMTDAGEKDDLELEILADESIAALRSIQPDEEVEREERKEALRRLVQFLEQSEDRAIRLIYRRYIEGASCKQMAAEEHIKPPTMRFLVRYAMASVRQTLIDVYQGEREEGAMPCPKNIAHCRFTNTWAVRGLEG